MALIGNVHIIAGDSADLERALALIESEGIGTRDSQDVFVRAYEHFGVDEARDVSLRAASRAVSLPRRIFLIAATVLTAEAQNALLKTLEEPAGDALFLLIVPSPFALLSTLRSRANMLTLAPSAGASVGGSAQDAVAFLAAPPAKRLDLLKPLLEKTDDDRRDIGAIIAFLAALEGMLAARKPLPKEALEAVYRARQYITDKGALAKPLLEQVALLA